VFDAAFAAAPGKVACTIHTSYDIPNWLLPSVAHFNSTDGNTYPACWDTNYMTAIASLIQAFGQRYNSNPKLARVVIPYVNAHTAETILSNIMGAHYSSTNQAKMLQLWDSVGYTPQKVLMAAQQSIQMMHQYVTAPCSIVWQPNYRGLDFDTINGTATMKSIQTWMAGQPNIFVYNCGASATWVFPRTFPNLPYVYQEAAAQLNQVNFNRMVGLAIGQKVDTIEIYQPDLPYVASAQTDATELVADEDGFYVSQENYDEGIEEEGTEEDTE
jgi:hypothetical protein